jgi:hypothetical protein
MFRSSDDHHQGAFWCWLKSLVKIWVFKCGYAAAYVLHVVLCCMERHVDMSTCLSIQYNMQTSQGVNTVPWQQESIRMTNFLLMEGLLRLSWEEKVKVHLSWPRILQCVCVQTGSKVRRLRQPSTKTLRSRLYTRWFVQQMEEQRKILPWFCAHSHVIFTKT